MRNKTELFLGAGILIFGSILLLSNLLQINIWRFAWPLILIGLGVLILVRQQRGRSFGTDAHFSFAKDINRHKNWEAADAEFWHFAGDLNLDFTNASIPEGEHKWRLFGFVHEIRLKVPENVGVALTANAIVIENKIEGQNEDRIFAGLAWKSPAYDLATNKFQIEANGIVVDARVTLTQSPIEMEE